MTYRIIVLLTLSLILSQLNAYEFDHPLSLSELIDISLKNHPQTKQAWWNAQRAAAALGGAKSAYYPEIVLHSSVTNGRDFKFIRGPNTTYTIVGSDLALSILLFDYGERKADVEAAKSALQAAHWETNWA